MKNKIILIILLIIALISFAVTAIFIYLSFSKKQEPTSLDYNLTLSLLNNTISKVQEKNQTLALETTILEVKPSKYILATEIEDYENAKKFITKEQNLTAYKPICKVKKSKKVEKRVFHDGIKRVAIIMDDIGNALQMKNLKSLHIPITPSFFPSTKDHIDTPKYAKEFKCYMVHVPMEAYNYPKPEIGTLKCSDSLKTIYKRIEKISKEFPKAVAINNHTGSKFTSNVKAMDKLFCALDQYSLRFIDSKTAPHTLGKKMQKLHHSYVYTRDIFLDNKADVGYILNQLKLTVKKAKKNGLAIAICHPRKETFEALKKASDLFEGVKLVYINELYK